MDTKELAEEFIYIPEYPPCAICGGPNDVGEVCVKCAKDNDPLGTDLESSGGWMVQDGRNRGD